MSAYTGRIYEVRTVHSDAEANALMAETYRGGPANTDLLPRWRYECSVPVYSGQDVIPTKVAHVLIRVSDMPVAK